VLADNGQIATLSTSTPIAKVKRVIGKAKKRQALVDTQKLTAERRDAFFLERSLIDLAENPLVSRPLRRQIAETIEKNGGEPITLNQVMSLYPAHKPLKRNELRGR
jgi:hypothetical protein